MSKLSRNAPCPCGSGRKYKKCCQKNENPMEPQPTKFDKVVEQSLKNEFRKEVQDPYAGIPEIELVKRDQAVLLKELRFREVSLKADQMHFEASIARSKEMRVGLLALPKSPYKVLVDKDLDEQIKALKEKLKTMRLPKSLQLSLLALEEIFAETSVSEGVKTISLNAEQKNKDVVTVEREGAERNKDGTPYIKGTSGEGKNAYEDTEDEDDLTIPAEPEEDVVETEEAPGVTI